ncbi:hypothetical protein OSJ57_23335 [Sphingomonas sp. HH69]
MAERKPVPINLMLADVRQALFDAAKSDPDTSNVLRYESGRAVAIMGEAMDTIAAQHAALADILDATGTEDGEGEYRADDREGCLDYVEATARSAIARATGAAS